MLINIFSIGMEAVIAQLVPHPEEKQQADGDAGAQAQHIDEAVAKISAKIANGNDQEMF